MAESAACAKPGGKALTVPLPAYRGTDFTFPIPRGRRILRPGFTLIEASLTIIIVGTGILGMVGLLGALTEQNATANRTTTAMLLATHIQETMAGLSFNDPAFGNAYFGAESGETLASYDDIDDFDSRTFSPPIDSTRAIIPELSQYTQEVTVWPVYSNNLNVNNNPASPNPPKTAYTGALRVQVRILHRTVPAKPQTEIYRTSWIRTAG